MDVNVDKEIKLLEKTHWVILTSKEEADKFSEPEFSVVSKTYNSFNNEYALLELELVYEEDEGTITTQDVLDITGAIAAHEEFSMYTVTTPDGLDILSEEVYTWISSGRVFLGDMLTSIEKLSIVCNEFHKDTGEYPLFENLTVKVKQNTDPVPLAQNLDKFFTDDIYSVIFTDKKEVEHTITIWWGTLLEKEDYKLVIIDEEYEEEKPKANLVPLKSKSTRNAYHWWDDYDDYYDYFNY